MEFKSNKERATKVDPFGALRREGTQPTGPGVGVARNELQVAPKNKRRVPGLQVFGDTPKRDGPFSMMAKPLQALYPSKARARREQKPPSGPNPFNSTRET